MLPDDQARVFGTYYAIYPISKPTEISCTTTMKTALAVFSVYFHSNQPARIVRMSSSRVLDVTPPVKANNA